MMKVLTTIFFVFLLNLAACDDNNKEPDIFEVYVPRGLRISVPDVKDIRYVQFTVTVPSHPDVLYKEIRQKDGRYWVFFDPNVVVNLHDKITYKIIIYNNNGAICTREGTYVVLNVLPLSAKQNETDYSESEGQKLIQILPNFEKSDEFRKGITSGKSSSYKSSYSTVKNSNLKPITKTSTSTTSGTFYVKPSGIMEATGYKSGSTFDSTKREGEQWEHYRSDLTAEELENMRRLYESGLHTFPQLTDKFFPTSAKVYEKSYMTSESKSFPEVHKITYGEGPVTTQKFFQTHKTHESSSYSHGKPIFQFHTTGGEGLSNRQGESTYRLESLNQLPHPLPPQGTIFKATEYVREEHTVPEVTQVNVGREVHTSSAPQKVIQVSQNEEFSSQHNQEVVKPKFSHIVTASGRGDQLEHVSGNLQTVERKDFNERQDNYRTNHYRGSIFTSVKSNKVHSPQECTLYPGVDYTSGKSVRELEKYVYELSCLATLAESTVKDEIALLKQKNAHLIQKLEYLEQEVKRISATCNCYE